MFNDFMTCLYAAFVAEPVAARYFFEWINTCAKLRRYKYLKLDF